MLTRRQILFGAMLATLSLAGVDAATAQTIKIGDINSYRGLPAHTIPYKNGAVLAVEQINAQGGVLGRKLELISRDDDVKPGEAVKIAEELFTKDGVALISGTLFSHVGLALAAYAGEKKRLYVAAEPLADGLVWENGNRYTFRLRPSTYTQASMLAEEAAKFPAKRWAMIAPNYAYGKEAVAAFKKALKAKRPDVEFVAEQWPALFKIEAGAEVQALLAANPEAIYNVTFGIDLQKFVREGELRGLFRGREIVGLLTGEPEYLDPLEKEAPKNWLVTGYPWYDIKEAAHVKFVEEYQKRWNDYPRIGSIVGYNTMLAISATLRKAGSTDTEKMVDAMKGIEFDSPTGRIQFRAIDHQATMGAWVGRTDLNKAGDRGIMINWRFLDGGKYMPSDQEVRSMRPPEKGGS